ncbi:MAG: hypothetical protein VKO64_00205 [Candidatus Sericytochromatia bacterium]|nr:hypothetical protein [Candidatus Sericytochromatia bacterium]
MAGLENAALALAKSGAVARAGARLLPVVSEVTKDVLRPAADELKLVARGLAQAEGAPAARGVGALVRDLLVRGGFLKPTVEEAPAFIRQLLDADSRFMNFTPVGDIQLGKVSGDVVSFSVPAKESVKHLGQYVAERPVSLQAEFNLADRSIRFLGAPTRAPLPADSAPWMPSDPQRHWNNFRKL